MKVRIIVPQSGLYNAAPWPLPGETIDLPEHVAQGMIRNGQVEDAKGKASDEAKEAAERAQAEADAAEAALAVERERAEKAATDAAASAKVETRPADTSNVEIPEAPSTAAKKVAAKKTSKS